MKHREHDRVMDMVEQQIIALLEGSVSREDLFWMRVDMGMSYLKDRYGEKEARRIWKKKAFWRWYRTVWHINDREILKHLNKGDDIFMMYRDIQCIRFKKYRIQKELVID